MSSLPGGRQHLGQQANKRIKTVALYVCKVDNIHTEKTRGGTGTFMFTCKNDVYSERLGPFVETDIQRM